MQPQVQTIQLYPKVGSLRVPHHGVPPTVCGALLAACGTLEALDDPPESLFRLLGYFLETEMFSADLRLLPAQCSLDDVQRFQLCYGSSGAFLVLELDYRILHIQRSKYSYQCS